MKVLLDTHCLLWMIAQPGRLGPKTRKLLDDRGTELLLSAASIFEISIKCSLGKLVLPQAPRDYLPPLLDRLDVRELAVTALHAYRVSELPWHHRDPFDRLLIAQSFVERLPLVTADEQVLRYKNPHLDAAK